MLRPSTDDQGCSTPVKLLLCDLKYGFKLIGQVTHIIWTLVDLEMLQWPAPGGTLLHRSAARQ